MDIKSGDRVLVARAQSGESSAFNELVRKYRHRVLKLSMRYTRNRADAEDAVQNTFIKAYFGLQHFRGDSAFYSWLHRIAVNSAMTAISLRARDAGICKFNTRSDDALNDASVALKELDTPEELALTEEICAAVNGAIGELCEEQRTAIVLRELEGLSYSEVALAMSCPLGTVRSRVFRAREAINAQLQQVFNNGLGRARRDVSSRTWPRVHLFTHSPPGQRPASERSVRSSSMRAPIPK
jgi:RNA polymerase sigma-70 factor (ECF subfamily)